MVRVSNGHFGQNSQNKNKPVHARMVQLRSFCKFERSIKSIQNNNQVMFSWCCSQNRPKEHFQLITKNKSNQTVFQYITDLNTVDQQTAASKETILRPIKMSDYKEALATCKKNRNQFCDLSFPPNPASLGDVGVENTQWKRIPQFINYPTLFDYKIDPCQVIHKHEGDCYLLSAIATLAQNPSIIKRVFEGQGYKEEGIYRIILNVNGALEEVVIDDYIPLTDQKVPIFCQPKIRDLTGQFWILLLEKALAKSKGSYQNLMQGLPSDVFRAVTGCPSQSLFFQQKDEDRIWQQMLRCTSKKQPCCVTSIDRLSKHSGLVPDHIYTVLSVASLTVNEVSEEGIIEQRKEKVVKLRDPWLAQRDHGWMGKGGFSDQEFWDSVQSDFSFKQIKENHSQNSQGIFIMPFNCFLQYFCQIHFCDIDNCTKKASQDVVVDKSSKGSFYDVSIKQKGTYSFELAQSAIFDKSKQQREDEGISRLSIVLIGEEEEKKVFMAGNAQQKDNVLLTVDLKPGSYTVYALVEPTPIYELVPDSATLSVYSSHLAEMRVSDPFKCSNILKDAFLNDGIKYERKISENNGKMTLSCRTLFQQGGFGYLVFSNQSSSDKAFVINYDQLQFDRSNIQVLQPQQHDKNFDIRVEPGHDMIILVRSRNERVGSWVFPPKMSVRMQTLFG